MPIFYLTIQPTFYERGFFNVTVDFDRFVRREEGPVTLTLKLGLKSENIEGRIERKSNTNGTARIHGNKSLRDWFKRNFKRYDVIAVDLSSREIIILDGQAGEKSSSTPQSVKTDVLSKATPQETNVFVSFKMKSLVNIGFRKVGEWKMLGESISPNIFDLANAANILYAFISDGEVLYVGKTTQELQKRLYGYQKPGPSQKTNIKVNPLLRELLVQGKSADIYAFPDDGLWHVGDFHLNLAAGLEDSIISVLKPKWNG